MAADSARMMGSWVEAPKSLSSTIGIGYPMVATDDVRAKGPGLPGCGQSNGHQ